MPRDPRAFLRDIQQAARRITMFLAGHDLASYQGSELLRSSNHLRAHQIIAVERPHQL
jgi:uncharacterized protein with HEPN domain